MFEWLRRLRRRASSDRDWQGDAELGRRMVEAVRASGITVDEIFASPLFQRAGAKRGNLDRMTTDATTMDPDRLEASRALFAAQAELVKAQIVSATRLDVIRLLATIGINFFRYPGEDELPEDPASRALLASQLQELSQHLRDRAESYAKIAARLHPAQPG